MQKSSFDKCKERNSLMCMHKYCIALVNFMVVRVGGILAYIEFIWMPTPLKRPIIKHTMNLQGPAMDSIW